MRFFQLILALRAKKALSTGIHFTAGNAFFARDQTAQPQQGARFGIHFHFFAASHSLRESPVYLKAERIPPTIA
jgi:hypothetical protein